MNINVKVAIVYYLGDDKVFMITIIMQSDRGLVFLSASYLRNS